MEALFLAISQLAVGAQDNLQVTGEVFLAEHFRDPHHALPLVIGNLQQGNSPPATFATIVLRIKRTICRAKWVGLWPSPIKGIDQTENLLARSFRDCVHYILEDSGGRSAYQLPNRVGSEASIARSDGLIEDRKRVTNGSVAGFGEQR